MRVTSMSAFSRFVILILAISTTACAQVQEWKSAERAALAKAADQTLDTGVYLVCPASSVGAVSRRYATEARIAVWRDFCNMDSNIDLP